LFIFQLPAMIALRFALSIVCSPYPYLAPNKRVRRRMAAAPVAGL